MVKAPRPKRGTKENGGSSTQTGAVEDRRTEVAFRQFLKNLSAMMAVYMAGKGDGSVEAVEAVPRPKVTKQKPAPAAVIKKAEGPIQATRACAYSKCSKGPLDPKLPNGLTVHSYRCLNRSKAEQKALLRKAGLPTGRKGPRP
ncbi:MAG: hypothetical protein ACLPJH_06265 [Myxococcaceae bacterium]